MEVERKKHRGSKRIRVPRIYTTEKWGAGSAGQKQDKESSGCDGTGMEYRKKEVWKGLGEEFMVYSTGWFGRCWDMGVERKREDGETRGEIFKVGYGLKRSEQQNARIHGKGGTVKKEDEGEGREAGVEI